MPVSDKNTVSLENLPTANESARVEPPKPKKPRFDLAKAREDCRAQLLGHYARAARTGEIPAHQDSRNMLDGKSIPALKKWAVKNKETATLDAIASYKFLFEADNGASAASHLLGLLLGKE